MNGSDRKPKRWSAAADRAREELLRPCPYLGYDHDRIGVHCLTKEAFGAAERFFRRAIWLNPYEPRFFLHLANALLRQRRFEEALVTLDELRERWPDVCEGDALRKTILVLTSEKGTGEKGTGVS
jgi:tetratricopeptide (TPR) repeat protein